MDVDAMSVEERADMMKKGLCFLCKKPGHRASDHKDKDFDPDKKGKASGSTQKKTDIRQLHDLLKSLSKEEKEGLVALQLKEEESSDF